MTDYVKLAEALRWTQPSNPVCSPRDYKVAVHYQTKVWRETVRSVADALAEDNSRFDRDRFYRAAGYTNV